jgi:general secretion pathway protein H
LEAGRIPGWFTARCLGKTLNLIAIKNQGFTLVELLIAMVLIGLMTGMAMLSMGNVDQSKQQQLEAKRLSMLLELAEQEAMVRSDAIAVELFSLGYRFLSLQGNQWQPITDDAIFKAYELQRPLQLTLQQDRQPAYLNQQAGMTQNPQPQLIITPDGLSENIHISIAHNKTDVLYGVANTEDGWIVSSVDVLP